MGERKLKSFAEFWPHYVADHSRPATRVLHAVGTLTSTALAAATVATGRWWLLPLTLLPGYGAAWVGHFFVERNRPASFRHPLWSFIADYKMVALMLAGRMEREVERTTSPSAALAAAGRNRASPRS